MLQWVVDLLTPLNPQFNTLWMNINKDIEGLPSVEEQGVVQGLEVVQGLDSLEAVVLEGDKTTTKHDRRGLLDAFS